MHKDSLNHPLDGLDNTDDSVQAGSNRRDFLRNSLFAAGAAGTFSSLILPSSAAYAAGSDAPEKPVVKVGFIPLT
ncbi:MAG TPA: twin-arginine translocation signal domain-containing protein, partial [Aquirhabdus sp.]